MTSTAADGLNMRSRAPAAARYVRPRSTPRMAQRRADVLQGGRQSGFSDSSSVAQAASERLALAPADMEPLPHRDRRRPGGEGT